ncbi:MAG: hypothetical protein GW905_04965 [Rhodobacterales bacterium]|nr:hypothetical protein [Rhodobacterales bacterium]
MLRPALACGGDIQENKDLAMSMIYIFDFLNIPAAGLNLLWRNGGDDA